MQALTEGRVDPQMLLPDLTKRGSSQLPESNSLRAKKVMGFLLLFPKQIRELLPTPSFISFISVDYARIRERKTGLTQSSSNSSTMLTYVKSKESIRIGLTRTIEGFADSFTVYSDPLRNRED